MLCQFQAYSKVTQSYIYMCIHSLSYSFPIQGITEYCIEFPVRYSRSLLVIYLIYSSTCMWAQLLRCVRHFYDFMDYIAHQTPLSMKFSRQEYWSKWPFPSSGDLHKPGIEPSSLASPALAGGLFDHCAAWICVCYPKFLIYPSKRFPLW